MNETKKGFKYWFITWNNPPTDWQTAAQTLSADYCICQLEKGENGTPHIQGLLYFHTSKRGSHFKDFPIWSKGISALDAASRVQHYCSKIDSRLDGPHEYGTKPKALAPGKDFEVAKNLAKKGKFDEITANILIPYWTNLHKVHAYFTEGSTTVEPRGLWLYGKPGVGKTHWARTEYPTAYIKAQNKWFDGYIDQESILLDDLDANGSCLGHHLKIWADKWSFQGEIKGGMVALRHQRFIITSNYLPEDLWVDNATLVEAIRRRFKFIFFISMKNIRKTDQFGAYPV